MDKQLRTFASTLACAGVVALCASPASAALRAVTFVSANVGWVAGDNAIYGTTNGGKAWQRQYNGRVQFWSLNFVTPSVGFAAGVDPSPGTGVLLGTKDGGRTWTNLGEPKGPARQVSFATALTGFAMAGGSPLTAGTVSERVPPFFGGRLASTTSGGQLWHILDAPELVDSTCASNATHMWAAYQAAVLRSDDGGDTFSNVLSPLIDTKRVWYATIQCSGSDVAWVQFAGTQVGDQRPYVVLRTADDGHTWQAVLANKKTTDAYPKLDPTYADGPGPWPGPFSAVDANSAFFLGVCPQCGARGAVSITGTIDAGKTWQAVATVPDVTAAGPIAISFSDAQHGWVVGSSAQGAPVIDVTADGGLTWTKQSIK
ncbi:MAG: hypothetical protein JO293_01815 [Candidatus Eremiobacteraeota bacterium]|nr:hypothetical protein [Candidatus Eremiobacteraeota bacterium]MBV8222072.1 hypothetical protein [Candidatus Eremiobacteraeota bacterium]